MAKIRTPTKTLSVWKVAPATVIMKPIPAVAATHSVRAAALAPRWPVVRDGAALTVTAALDTGEYPKGIKITDKEMKAFEAVHLQRHEFHGDWNYALLPSRTKH